MTPDIVAWLTAPRDVHERRVRIARYLANEGYELPAPPSDADTSEAGAIHRVCGQEMAVAYSVVDQGGQRVYYYAEYEVEHILLRRIRRAEEWALEHLSLIPSVMRDGRVVIQEIGRIIYESRRWFHSPEGERYRLRVVIQEREDGHWWVTSFHPRPF